MVLAPAYEIEEILNKYNCSIISSDEYNTNTLIINNKTFDTINIKNIKNISDLGSGINFKKKGLKELINLIINNKVDTVYLTNKDRLLRFGTELIISISEEFNTKIKFIYEKEETFEERLSKDILEIITVFSSRLYGKKSHKNINKLKKLSKI